MACRHRGGPRIGISAYEKSRCLEYAHTETSNAAVADPPQYSGQETGATLGADEPHGRDSAETRPGLPYSQRGGPFPAGAAFPLSTRTGGCCAPAGLPPSLARWRKPVNESIGSKIGAGKKLSNCAGGIDVTTEKVDG